MARIRHRMSGVEIEGIRLKPGTQLVSTDMYDRTDGDWAPNPGAGQVPTGDHVV